MKILKIITTAIFLFLLCCSQIIFAQPGGKKKEQIEALRMAFITNKLELTGKEAQQFWPVYNEYQDKLEALRKTRKMEIRQESGKLETITDQEAEQIIEAELGLRAKEVELNKIDFAKFKQVLSAKKVLKLMRAEEEFKKELIKQLKDKN